MKKFSQIMEYVNATSGGIRGFGVVSGNPDGDSISYVGGNIINADTRNNDIFQRTKSHAEIHANPNAEIKKGIKEELKVGEKENSRVKRKYIGKVRGRNKTGSKAHAINVSPSIPDGKSRHAF